MTPSQQSVPTIGILAGMGPHSTAPFLTLLIDECQRQFGAVDDLDFPPIMIRSHPTPFYPDRPADHAAMSHAVRDGLEILERSGVDLLAIACNTAHIYFDDLVTAVRVPLLDIVQSALNRIPKDARRVALIAARPTAESGIYQRRLRNAGFEVVDIDWQSEIDALLSASRSRPSPVQSADAWSSLTDKAAAMNVDALVIACLDLSALIEHVNTSIVVVDASQCLAADVITEWLKMRRQV
jgi:aspartate racemase